MEPQSVSPLLVNSVGALAALFLVVSIVKALTGMLKTVKVNGNGGSEYSSGQREKHILHYDQIGRILVDCEAHKSDMHEIKVSFKVLAENSKEQTRLLGQLVMLRRQFLVESADKEI